MGEMEGDKPSPTPLPERGVFRVRPSPLSPFPVPFSLVPSASTLLPSTRKLFSWDGDVNPPEESPARLPIAEKLVARLWEAQRPLTFPMQTTTGEEIRVVYRGRRRWDRGPDFTGALIARDAGRLDRGDVEVHVRSSDWRAHGHHRDRHYNGVILQAVLWHDDPGPTLRQDGATVPVVALADHLSVSIETLLSAPEADLPAASPCWRGSPDDGHLAELLDRCGMDRFAARSVSFESDLTRGSVEQLLYAGIATALGYSQNRGPFRRLAEVLPLDLLKAFRTQGRGDAGTRRQEERRREGSPPHSGEGLGPVDCAHHSSLITYYSSPTALEALLLGAAGLLPSQRGLDLNVADGYVQKLEEIWADEGASWVADPMDPGSWQFFRVRPANFPTRRVAVLAGLVDRWPSAGMLETLAGMVCCVEPRFAARCLESLLLEGASRGYWALHWDFGLCLRRPAGLIGRQRAAEIAINAFLPALVAWASLTGDTVLEGRVLDAYRCYPKRGDNEISRYVATRITGVPRPRVARSACRQQGLLHIYRAWCEEKRCGECPCGSLSLC